MKHNLKFDKKNTIGATNITLSSRSTPPWPALFFRYLSANV
jgi:hypothetical protein